MSFTHLHNHTEYSLLDGISQMKPMVERVAEMGQDAIAITDHGWIAGAVKLTKACEGTGVKPIIGSELYVAEHDDLDEITRNYYHLTVLCQNREGYANLVWLSSHGFLDGFNYKPQISRTWFKDHGEGLIVLSGCVGAEIPQHLIHGRMKEARKLTEFYRDTLPGRFFIELMVHGNTDGIDHVREIDKETKEILMEETQLNDALVDLSEEFDVPLVATNDAHYVHRDEGDTQDLAMCIGMGTWKGDKDRLKFPGVDEEAFEFYIKTDEEMRSMSEYQWWDRACDQTVEIANLVEENVIPMGEVMLPNFKIPPDPEFERKERERLSDII